jgi:valyl-tRNA synthetase
VTGNEGLVEKWILHKLNVTLGEVNKQLAERNFMAATTAAHNFWLYELCDVYIVSSNVRLESSFLKHVLQEAMKPITDKAAPATARESAKQTLYTSLDYGLRLLHPFMPFITEELWQRLPRRHGDSTPSIMVARYPVFVRPPTIPRPRR